MKIENTQVSEKIKQHIKNKSMNQRTKHKGN